MGNLLTIQLPWISIRSFIMSINLPSSPPVAFWFLSPSVVSSAFSPSEFSWSVFTSVCFPSSSSLLSSAGFSWPSSGFFVVSSDLLSASLAGSCSTLFSPSVSFFSVSFVPPCGSSAFSAGGSDPGSFSSEDFACSVFSSPAFSTGGSDPGSSVDFTSSVFSFDGSDSGFCSPEDFASSVFSSPDFSVGGSDSGFFSSEDFGSSTFSSPAFSVGGSDSGFCSSEDFTSSVFSSSFGTSFLSYYTIFHSVITTLKIVTFHEERRK